MRHAQRGCLRQGDACHKRALPGASSEASMRGASGRDRWKHPCLPRLAVMPWPVTHAPSLPRRTPAGPPASGAHPRVRREQRRRALTPQSSWPNGEEARYACSPTHRPLQRLPLLALEGERDSRQNLRRCQRKAPPPPLRPSAPPKSLWQHACRPARRSSVRRGNVRGSRPCLPCMAMTPRTVKRAPYLSLGTPAALQVSDDTGAAVGVYQTDGARWTA